MAQGIFDFLASEAAQPGLMLLAQGGGGLGQVASGLMQQQIAMEDRKAQREERALRQRLGGAQLANYQSEIDNRALGAKKDARQQDLIASFLGGGSPAGQGAGYIQPGEGGGGAPGGAAGILALAQQYGIPPQAIQADIAFNGGKNISELLAKHGGRDMQVTNGYAYDRNRMGPGFMPSLNTTASGQSTVTHIAPNGQPIVSAPQGATDVYGQYKDIDNRTSARYTPGRPVIGADNRMYPQSQLDEVGGGAPRAPAGPAPGMGGRAGPTNPAEQGMAAQVAGVQIDPQREIAAVMRELPTLNAQDRAQALAYVQRLQGQAQGQGTPAQAQSPAMGAVDFSPADKAAQAAAEARLVGQAKADIAPSDQRASGISQSREMLNGIDMLRNHPGRETGTGLSSYADPRNFIPGTDAKDFQVALDQVKGKTFLQAFESLKGAGQITEVEGRKATEAIARLNTAQSDKSFSGALDDLERVVRGSMARQEGSASRSGVQAGQSAREGESKPAQNLLASLPPANGANKGKRARDTETGKVYVSNGLQWKEE